MKNFKLFLTQWPENIRNMQQQCGIKDFDMLEANADERYNDTIGGTLYNVILQYLTYIFS